MSSRGEWVVASFSSERGCGSLRNVQTGAETAFNVEIWSPCEPGTALVLAESERRRHLLLPREGEAVDVSWQDAGRIGAPLHVVRRGPLDEVLPPLSFAAWVWRMGRHVPQLARWTDEEWTRLYEGAEEGIEEVVRSPEPITPELHLAFLEVLRDHGPADIAQRRFTWIESAPKPGLTALESFNDTGTAYVALPSPTIETLVAERLVLLA